jgi:hypothetical protein
VRNQSRKRKDFLLLHHWTNRGFLCGRIGSTYRKEFENGGPNPYQIWRKQMQGSRIFAGRQEQHEQARKAAEI